MGDKRNGKKRCMDANNADDPTVHVPIGDLKIEPGAEDLIDSPAMEPYVKLAFAVMRTQRRGSGD